MQGKLRLFDPRDHTITPAQARRYARFEIVHTIVDFTAAFLFIIGSVLFFFEQTKLPGTFCFLFGSLFFAAKPAIRLAREIWLARLKDIDQLAKMAPEGPGSFKTLRGGDGDGAPGDGEKPTGEESADGRADSGRFNRGGN